MSENLPAETEASLRREQEEHAYQVALLQLEAQERDRQREREHEEKLSNASLYALTIVSVCLLLFFVAAFYFRQQETVIEIVKALCYVGSGGIGGYAVGRGRKNGNTE
jgi:hypothetical protein